MTIFDSQNDQKGDTPQKKTVTGTNADLRKLNLADAKKILRDKGFPEAEVWLLLSCYIILYYVILYYHHHVKYEKLVKKLTCNAFKLITCEQCFGINLLCDNIYIISLFVTYGNLACSMMTFRPTFIYMYMGLCSEITDSLISMNRLESWVDGRL